MDNPMLLHLTDSAIILGQSTYIWLKLTEFVQSLCEKKKKIGKMQNKGSCTCKHHQWNILFFPI